MSDEEQIRFWGHVATTLSLLTTLYAWLKLYFVRSGDGISHEKSLAVILFDNEL